MADEQKKAQGQGEGDNNIFIFKGRFKSNSLGLYGLFLIIFNAKKIIDTYNLVVSTYSSIYDVEPHVSWEKYEETILDHRWKGNFNTSMSASLMDQIKAISVDEGYTGQLFDYINNYNYDGADALLFDIINRVIHEKNLILETGIQEVSYAEFQELKEKRFKPQDDSKNKQAELEDEGSVVLAVEPILSPVKGKPLYEIKIGDKIMIKITPSSDRANYFIDLLNLRIENHIKPVPGEVIDIKADSKTDPVEILTQIGPGIFGKCIEDERQVKLRIYNPTTDSSVSQKSVSPSKINPEIKKKFEVDDLEKPVFARSTWLLVALFAIIVIIFVSFIYFFLL